MSRYDRQLSAAARQYESRCDCCDRRAITDEAAEALAELEREPYADTLAEWAGLSPREDAVSESLAEVRRLNRLLGPDWVNE